MAKGKKVITFTIKGKADSDTLDAMLGPTGNLRAPTFVSGKTIVVGFNDEAYTEVLGG